MLLWASWRVCLAAPDNEKYSGQCKRNERNGKESIEFQCENKKCHILKRIPFGVRFFTFGREDVTKMKRKYRQLAAVLMFLVCLSGCAMSPQKETQKVREASTQAVMEEGVIPGACRSGLHGDGWCYGTWYRPDHRRRRKTVSAAENLVRPGDYIVAWNDEKIENKKELFQKLSDLDEDQVALTLRRGQQELTVAVKPVETKPDEYKLGIWVRDNVQGLGTITFMTRDGAFGALGHGIHDMDTSALLSIRQGTLYKTSIHSIQKGQNGIPGSMEGMIVYSHYNRLGTIDKNTEAGIYGTIESAEKLFLQQEMVPVAERGEIQKGKAVIRCYVNGEVENYDILVTDIDDSGQEINKGLVIEITDQRLLDATGGIIQGMSGSPIYRTES